MKKRTSHEPIQALFHSIYRGLCILLALVVSAGMLSQSASLVAAEEYNLSVSVQGPGSVILLDQENSQEITSSLVQLQIEEGREYSVQAVPETGARLVSMNVNGQSMGSSAVYLTASSDLTTVSAVFEYEQDEPSQSEVEPDASSETKEPDQQEEPDASSQNDPDTSDTVIEDDNTVLGTSDLGDLVEADKISEATFNAMSSRRTLRRVASLTGDESESTGDNEIESLSVTWISPKETTDLMTVTPSGYGTFNVRMRLEGSLSGENPYAVGDVNISIPKSIWTDRDGNPIGVMNFSVPEAPDTRGTFAYSETEDAYVLTNTKALAAATAFYFEFTISNLKPTEIYDLVTGYQTDPFYGILSITSANGESVSRKSNEIVANMNTMEKVTQASGMKLGTVKSWNDSWPAELKPDNADDYYYASWYVYCKKSGNQPYELTIDTTSTDAYNGEILGMKYGQTVYEGNTAQLADDEWKSDGDGYYVTVYTAYPKSEFTEEGVYTVSMNATYTLTPEDDRDQATTASVDLKDSIIVRSFSGSTGYFGLWKTGANWKDTYVYNFALNQLMNGEETDLDYHIETIAFGYPWTLEGDASDPSNYGKKSYTVTTVDDEVFFNEKINGLYSDEARLTDSSQYEFKQLQVNVPNVYVYQEFETSGYGYQDTDSGVSYTSIAAGDYGYKSVSDKTLYPDLNVYDTSSGERVLMATISWNGNTKAYNGAKVKGTTVTFPEGVTQYETEYTTTAAGVIWYITPTITLKPEESIISQLEDLFDSELTPQTTLSNVAGMKATGENLNLVIDDHSDNHVGIDSIAGAQLAAGVEKSVSTTNDPGNRVVYLNYTVKVIEQTNLTDLDEYNLAMENGYLTEQTEGTFYDLLPYGAKIDLDSVKLRSGDTITDVSLIKNYKDTGRDLLVVKADLTPVVTSYTTNTYAGLKGYRDTLYLTYTATYTWENLDDLGTTVDNRAAFESGNGDLGTLPNYQGEYNNDPLQKRNINTSQAISGAEELMTSLPSDNEDASFIYAKNIHKIVADTTSVSSLTKTVAVNNDGLYGTGLGDYPLDVYELGYYTYRFRFQDVQNSSSQGLIFYDSLETWTNLNEDDQGDSTWQGIFRNVDTTDLKNAGVDAKVYWSSEDLNLYNADDTSDCDLTNGKWHLLDENTDVTKVRSIAVDCTKALDGSDFVLETGKALTFYVNMKAPDYQEGHAYNAASIMYQQNEKAKPTLIYNEYTKVGLRTYSITVNKVWSDGNNQDGLRTESVTVNLKRDGTVVDTAVLNSENSWSWEFDRILYGDEDGNPYFYSFEETDLPEGYTAIVSSKTTDGNKAVTITNKHTPETINITGTKSWENDQEETRPDSVTVVLYKDGKTYRTASATQDSDWTYSFKNLPKYEDGRLIEYTVQENSYIEGYVSTINGWDITNTYDPYGTLVLTKEVNGSTAQSSQNDFTFTLTITEADGVTPVANSYKYTTSDGRSGTISNGESLTLKEGQSATVENVDSECIYTWQEDSKDGYQLESVTNATGQIQAGKTYETCFTNVYKTKGKAYVKATKVVENHALSTGQFGFTLKDENGQTVGTAYSKADGSVSFSSLSYSNEDDGKTFTYTLQEIDGGLPGYTYDDREITVLITPKDNGDGTMDCYVDYREEGTKTAVLFVNTYKATGSTVLTAWKQLVGRDLQDQEFTFELLYNGEVISTAKNDINGTISFDALEYTEQDIGKTYLYTIREKAGDDDTVVYSDQTFTYTVTISDNNDGTLSIQQEKGQEDLPVFVNKLQTGTVKVTKKIEGDADPNKEFTFHIKFTGPSSSDEEESLQFERKQIEEE